MAEVIKMPKMSDTMEEGVIVAWHKKVGDKVEPGDILAEVETDKATMDLESYQEGTLLYIGVKEGAVPVNSVIAVIGEEGEDYQEALDAAEGGSGEEKEESAPDKDKEEEKEPQKESDTDSEKEGREDDKKQVKKEEEKDRDKEEKTSTDKGEGGETDGERLRVSPLARKMAEESGIDIAKLKGSGDHGRIVKRDVEKAVEEGVPAGDSGAQTGAVESSEKLPLSQMRKTIARRLGESKFTAPHFYLTVEIDMSRAKNTRSKINEMIAPDKISFNDLVIKACASALKLHPKVNSSWMDDHILQNNHIHIGVAVAVDEGLLVPVLRHVDQMNLSSINSQVAHFAEKARNKKLQPEEMKGNTFTISNLGMFGIEEFTAIINPPDACILAIGGIREVPVVENGEIKIGNRMKVTMSCDHRVVDGATGAKFLADLKSMLEEPLRMMV